MYAKNISTFLLHLVKDGQASLSLDDEILRETLVTGGGEVANARVRESMGLPPLQPMA
jgi:H+-translocating NAD(P) transhydrogenase subunit alpha